MVIWVWRATEMFLQVRLDRANHVELVQEIGAPAQRLSVIPAHTNFAAHRWRSRALARRLEGWPRVPVAAILRDACFASSSSDNGEAVTRG